MISNNNIPTMDVPFTIYLTILTGHFGWRTVTFSCLINDNVRNIQVSFLALVGGMILYCPYLNFIYILPSSCFKGMKANTMVALSKVYREEDEAYQELVTATTMFFQYLLQPS